MTADEASALDVRTPAPDAPPVAFPTDADPGASSWTSLVYIGWKNLFGDRMRSTVSIVGVTFAVFLMLLQSAIYLGFMHSASAVIDNCAGDLWIVKAETLNVETAPPFREDEVVRVRGTPGIAWAENLIYSFGHLKLPNGSRQWAHVVGFDPRTGIGGPWKMVQGDIAELTRPGTYVIDRTSLARFHGARVGDRLENFDHEVEIVGMSDGARSCTPNPVVFTSFRTAQEHIPLFAQKTNFIVAEFEPGADRAAVLERLARLTHFDVLTKAQFSNRTRRYWATRTGIGIGIGVTIVLGFIVGLVFVGQTMYSSTMDRLEEYAALKIMGATNLHICAIIWYQACLLAVLGYAIGGGTGFLLQKTYTDQVVSMHIPPSLLFALAFGTVAMCLGASLLSVARVLKVAPSSLFRV